jgi:hypothetical protein
MKNLDYLVSQLDTLDNEHQDSVYGGIVSVDLHLPLTDNPPTNGGDCKCLDLIC